MEVKEVIAKNLTKLRQQKKLTQNELAKKINYTDKSVSKWEHGDTTPPIDVLCKLAEFYGVNLDYLVTEDPDEKFNKYYNHSQNKHNKLIITLLAESIVWLIATMAFVYTKNALYNNWLFFVIAVPESCIVGIIFNSLWGKRWFLFFLISVLIWSTLASVYLCLLKNNLWEMFFLGIPLQIAVVLWAQLKPNKK